MRYLLLFSILLLLGYNLTAQVWRKTANVLGEDVGFSVVELEQGYVALGRGRPEGGSSTHYLLWLDQNGIFQQVVTAESLNIPGLRSFGNQILVSENNTLIVGADISSDIGYIEFSLSGEMLSNVRFQLDNEVRISQIVLCSDGGKLLVGRETVLNNFDYDVVTLKVDSLDNVEWLDVYGKVGASQDQAYAALESISGGFLIAGGVTGEDHNSEDRFIRRLTVQGIEEWTYLAPATPTWDDFVWNMIELEDESIYTNSRRFFPGNNILEKFTSTGELIWGREFPLNFPNTILGLKPFDFLLNNEGSFTFSGTYKGSIFLFKLDLEGELLSAVAFQECPIGDNNPGLIQDLIQTSDNGYLLLNFQSELPYPMRSLILIKTDSLLESFPSSNTMAIEGQICNNFPFEYNGLNYYQPGIYLDYLDYPEDGCDTLLTLHIDQAFSTESSLNVQICPDESLFFLGDTIVTDGFYEFVIPSGNESGCDSIINLLVSTAPLTGSFVNDFICQEGEYIIGDSVFMAPGQYEVTLAEANQFGCDSVISLTLTPSSVLFLQSNELVNDMGQGTGSISPIYAGGLSPYTYQWNTGDTTQTLTGLIAGEYEVTVIDANECLYVFEFTVDLINRTDNSLNDLVRLFPNPISTEGELFISGLVDDFQIKLYDTRGRLVLNQSQMREDNSVDLPIHLNSGVYFVIINTQSGSLRQRLVVH